MPVLAEIMLRQELLIWTTFHSCLHLQQQIRFVMWPHHPHWRQLLPFILPTTPSITQLVHCSLKRLPLKLFVKTILGIDWRVSFRWWSKVGVFIHRIWNRKTIPHQWHPPSVNVRPIHTSESIRYFSPTVVLSRIHSIS